MYIYVHIYMVPTPWVEHSNEELPVEITIDQGQDVRLT